MLLYHRLSLFCLGGMGAGILVTVILFIKLEIRTAWRVLARRTDLGSRKEEKAREKKDQRLDQKYRRERDEEPKTVLLPGRKQNGRK